MSIWAIIYCSYDGCEGQGRLKQNSVLTQVSGGFKLDTLHKGPPSQCMVETKRSYPLGSLLALSMKKSWICSMYKNFHDHQPASYNPQNTECCFLTLYLCLQSPLFMGYFAFPCFSYLLVKFKLILCLSSYVLYISSFPRTNVDTSSSMFSLYFVNIVNS